MRVMIAALAAAMTFVWIAPDIAEAQSRGARTKKYKQAKVERRAASVGPNGLCQRDTGTPDSQLNFRNVCDTEEYWRRTMERGSGIGR